MFGSGNDDRNVIPVTVTFHNGTVLQGHLFAGITGKLADLVNKADAFLEFAKSSGEVIMVAKSSIASIAPVKVVKIDQLSRRMQESGLPNPYTVLGLKPGATTVEIQNAYHSLARRYHPDHFSGREIPPEVLQYVSAMFQRITAAYNELKTGSSGSAAAAQQQPQDAQHQTGHQQQAAQQQTAQQHAGHQQAAEQPGSRSAFGTATPQSAA